MKIHEYKYPLLAFKKNDKHIYGIKKAFGIVSKGGDGFYKGLTIIDVEGNLYKTKKVSIKGTAKLKYCLMYFQKMQELNIEFEDTVEKISLDELKEKVIKKIEKHPKFWLNMFGIIVKDLVERVKDAKDFKELILMFY